MTDKELQVLAKLVVEELQKAKHTCCGLSEDEEHFTNTRLF